MEDDTQYGIHVNDTHDHLKIYSVEKLHIIAKIYYTHIKSPMYNNNHNHKVLLATVTV